MKSLALFICFSIVCFFGGMSVAGLATMLVWAQNNHPLFFLAALGGVSVLGGHLLALKFNFKF